MIMLKYVNNNEQLGNKLFYTSYCMLVLYFSKTNPSKHLNISLTTGLKLGLVHDVL